jgi:hypothetical protein
MILSAALFIPLISAHAANSPPVEEKESAAVPYCLGDLNGDARVTAADARLALRASAKLTTLTQVQSAAADVFFDGEISAASARKILRSSAKLERLWSAPMLSAEVEKRVREDGFKALSRASSVENFLIQRYYGTFNGSVAVMFNGVFNAIIHTETVGGIQVGFGTPDTIYVWKDGDLLWWKSAYEQGWLTLEDVQSIADIHNSGGGWVL